MEQQRLQAIEALEISDNSVKCQRCGNAVPIVGKLSRRHNDRAVILQRRIKWMENYYHGVNINDVKALKQELAELLGEDAKADKLRSLPLYSSELLAGNLCVQSVIIRLFEKSLKSYNL